MSSKQVLKVDFHVHSHFSLDSDMPPEDIINIARKCGLDAIAVTDHNTIKGGIETEKLSKDLIVFVGAEIKTMGGEIIGLNIKRDVQPGLSLLQTCKLIKEQNGLVIIPHPFDKFRSGIGNEIEKIIKYIDAVEVFNARTLVDKFNQKSLEFAQKNKLPFVAGSDAHFGSEIGSVCMLVEAEKNKDEILKAIKNGETRISGKKTGMLPHWKTFVTKMGKKI